MELRARSWPMVRALAQDVVVEKACDWGCARNAGVDVDVGVVMSRGTFFGSWVRVCEEMRDDGRELRVRVLVKDRIGRDILAARVCEIGVAQVCKLESAAFSVAGLSRRSPDALDWVS